MLHKIVRVLAGSAAVLGTLSVVPMISERATAQQPGFGGQFRGPGFQPAPVPQRLRPTDLVIPPRFGILAGMQGQQGGIQGGGIGGGIQGGGFGGGIQGGGIGGGIQGGG